MKRDQEEVASGGGAYEPKQPIRSRPVTTGVMKSATLMAAGASAAVSPAVVLVPNRLSVSKNMFLTALAWFCSCLLAAACGGKLPDPEVKVEVLHRPFLCHRKSKYGDILLVHHEGYFENGTRFHNRCASDLLLQGYSCIIVYI